MPTYEYLCQACSHRFETWQKMIEEPLTVCPQCGEHIRRVLFPAGIVFKGTGFYKTDHGKNGAISVAKDANGEPKKTEDKSATTSESKPSESSNSTNSTNGTSAKSTGESKASTAAATAD
jgi:putative FmdB family regulatory protein